MNDTTTVRVQKSTRELLNETAAASNVTVDSLIQDALKAYEWEKYKIQARVDAELIAANPREQELAKSISENFDAMAKAEPYEIPPEDPRYPLRQARRRLLAAGSDRKDVPTPSLTAEDTPAAEPVVEASETPAEKPAKKPARKRAAKKSARPPESPVRAWAAEQGFTVADRGRVSTDELVQ